MARQVWALIWPEMKFQDLLQVHQVEVEEELEDLQTVWRQNFQKIQVAEVVEAEPQTAKRQSSEVAAELLGRSVEEVGHCEVAEGHYEEAEEH